MKTVFVMGSNGLLGQKLTAKILVKNSVNLINEISSSSLNQTAKRPAKTGFILDKAMTELNYHPHSFTEGLRVLRNNK